MSSLPSNVNPSASATWTYSGRPIGAHDMLIGAHARSEGMTVVTNNLREFKRIPELRTENWV
jgi:tRNA(fMet)-specific endonuclease VapC